MAMAFLHRERERLINERNFLTEERRERINRGKSCIYSCCFCCALIGLIALLLVGVISGYHHLKRPTKPVKASIYCNSSECLGNIDLSKVGFPKNFSQLLLQNDKLCDAVTNKEASSQGNIYIVKGEHNLTDEQACGIESILRLFPDRTIYLIDFTKNEDLSYNKCSGTSKPNYLGLISYLYKDRLEFIKANKLEFFKYTPLQNLINKGDNFQFLAIMLTAYKYGGFVTSPDVIMTSRDIIECFPEETIVEPFAIMTSKKCDDFLHYLMQSFSVCSQMQTGSLDTTLTQSAELYSRSQSSVSPPVRRMRPEEVCSNVRQPCTFLRVFKEFNKEGARMVNDISTFCKQVVQAYLGIKINQMEVEEETSRIKSTIKESAGKKNCESLKFKSCNNKASGLHPNNKVST